MISNFLRHVRASLAEFLENVELNITPEIVVCRPRRLAPAQHKPWISKKENLQILPCMSRTSVKVGTYMCEG